MLAEVLAAPQLSQARKVTVEGDDVSIERLSGDGYDVVRGRLPVVISVVEKINEPRYPSFKGIMAAKSKPVQTMTVADLGLDAADLGLAAATTQVVDFATAPPRQAGQVVVDEGDGGVKIADFLAARKLI
jgi:electron transfer flavoprotein beta subunit